MVLSIYYKYIYIEYNDLFYINNTDIYIYMFIYRYVCVYIYIRIDFPGSLPGHMLTASKACRKGNTPLSLDVVQISTITISSGYLYSQKNMYS